MGDLSSGVEQRSQLAALFGSLARATSVEAYADALVSCLGRLIPADIVAYNDVVPDGPTLLVTEPPLALQQVERDLGRYSVEHPLIVYYRTTGDPSAMRVSDLVSLEEFRRTTLYDRVFAPFDIDHVIAVVALDRADRFAALALLRCDVDFTEDEKQFLEQLRPALGALLEQTLAHDHHRMLRAGLAGAGLDVVEVDRRGRITSATDRAITRLRHHVGGDGIELPAPVRRWVEDRVERTALQTEPYICDRHGRRLTIRFISGGRLDARVLLLHLEGGLPDTDALQVDLGLTPREAEVLRLVVAGLSNKRIAAQLQLAVSTVKKHLERIFRHMGVTSRAEAIAVALHTLELSTEPLD